MRDISHILHAAESRLRLALKQGAGFEEHRRFVQSRR
ncbi:MAG: hypothetical protein DMG58_16615 [Acidobacteria bacterium]|nr:MAG: hypothetical protein DMG58_16615 [Acidobacteriota bacterium]